MADEKYLENAGITISIGTQAVDPSGDTFTQIKRILTIGDFGSEAEISDDATCLEDTVKEKRKGIPDSGDLEITGNLIPSDPGQLLLKAAADMKTNLPHNIRIEFNDMPSGGANGTTFDIKCLVGSYKKSVGDVDGKFGFSSTAAISGAITETAAV